MARKVKREVVVELGPGAAAHLLPDESAEAYRSLREEILTELAPKTARQRLVADNLVDLEWDIARHRRMLAAVARSEFRRQAEGAMGRTAFFSKTMPISDSQFGSSLLSGDAAAEKKLAQRGVTLSELTAAAMLARSETIAYHEGRIADLERRRRFLHADYDQLTARRLKKPDIGDAEVVG